MPLVPIWNEENLVPGRWLVHRLAPGWPPAGAQVGVFDVSGGQEEWPQLTQHGRPALWKSTTYNSHLTNTGPSL